jgi:ketopantoate reductase
MLSRCGGLKHAILGAGAVGGLIGAALAHGGDQVTVLVRPESLVRHPSQLCLESLSGRIEAPIRLDTNLSAVVDVLWIAVKAAPARSRAERDSTRWSPNCNDRRSAAQWD